MSHQSLAGLTPAAYAAHWKDHQHPQRLYSLTGLPHWVSPPRYFLGATVEEEECRM